SITADPVENRALVLPDHLQAFIGRYPEREDAVRQAYIDSVPDFVNPDWVRQRFPVTPGFLRKLDPLFRNVQQ
ncbi:hypothetical protein, partial [Enterobacter hormaechei]|uniref:hypothetical protein n=1 Tax=Enterobacter hormaechei TaxID=158836 RepID=UPI001953AA20